MITSTQLKQITAEARPIIERMLNDATALAGLRDVVAAAGGDWSQLKALLKAQIQDEEAGEDKRVRKILDKAEYATAYADMLGFSAFSKMNEENYSEGDIPEHDADGVIIEREVPVTVAAAGASPALASIAAAQVANANKGENDVAPPPAHAPEQPGNDHGSVSTPDEGGADSSEISVAA